MKPALFLYPHVSSYPVLLLLGFFFGWLLARRRAPKFGLAGKHLDNIALLLPLTGLLGARVFARLFYEKVPFVEALQFWKGDGLVFYGGFVFCFAALIIYSAVRRLNLVALSDCLAPSLALGLAFGRVGCFLAGCCWGDICVPVKTADPVVQAQIQTVPGGSVFAVTFPIKSAAAEQHVQLGLISSNANRSLPVHPVQLYEAALAAGLCWLLHIASRGTHGVRPGYTSLAMLLGYAFIRFCTEILRADNKIYAAGFTFSQVVSLWLAGFCVAVIAVRWIIRAASARAAAVPYKPHPASG